MPEEVGGIQDVRGACWKCGKDGKFSGIACPGARAIFMCADCDLRKGYRPTGFRHHRRNAGFLLRDHADAMGWTPSQLSAMEVGRYHATSLEVRLWWAALRKLIEGRKPIV